MAKTKPTLKPVEELSYEEALVELEGIVEALEGEQNPLEDSMKLLTWCPPGFELQLNRFELNCCGCLHRRSW